MPPSDHLVSKRINEAVQRLVEEFRDKVPNETIVRSVEEAIGSYQDARVMDFVPLLVYRSTRDHLDTLVADRRP